MINGFYIPIKLHLYVFELLEMQYAYHILMHLSHKQQNELEIFHLPLMVLHEFDLNHLSVILILLLIDLCPKNNQSF